jgi:hypothetical protein
LRHEMPPDFSLLTRSSIRNLRHHYRNHKTKDSYGA